MTMLLLLLHCILAASLRTVAVIGSPLTLQSPVFNGLPTVSPNLQGPHLRRRLRRPSLSYWLARLDHHTTRTPSVNYKLSAVLTDA